MNKFGIQKPETANLTFSPGVPHWRDRGKNYNIQDNIKTLLGRDFEVEKVMRFLKEVGVFKEILKQ